MSASVHDFRVIQIVGQRYGRKSAVGQALIRRIVADQKQGLSGRAVLHEAFETTRREPEPPEVA